MVNWDEAPGLLLPSCRVKVFIEGLLVLHQNVTHVTVEVKHPQVQNRDLVNLIIAEVAGGVIFNRANVILKRLKRSNFGRMDPGGHPSLSLPLYEIKFRFRMYWDSLGRW